MMRARRRSAVRPPRRRGYRGWRIAGWRRWSRSWRRLREEGSRASRLDRARIASWLSIVAFRGGCVQRGDLGAAAALRGGCGNREELEPQGGTEEHGGNPTYGNRCTAQAQGEKRVFRQFASTGAVGRAGGFSSGGGPRATGRDSGG